MPLTLLHSERPKLYRMSAILSAIGSMCQHLELHCSLSVKILKIGTCKIITAVLLKIEQFVFIVQLCIQKMQMEWQIE